MQSSSRSRPFKSGLIGASPITDARWPNASCPRSSVRSERHRAKVEVAGAIPAVDAILPLGRNRSTGAFSQIRIPEARGRWAPVRGRGCGSAPAGPLIQQSISHKLDQRAELLVSQSDWGDQQRVEALEDWINWAAEEHQIGSDAGIEGIIVAS